MDNATTTETLTDTMILGLRDEAGSAGDLVQKMICDMALGREEPVPGAAEWEERFGGGGFSHDEEMRMRRVSSQDDARKMCAEAINAARCMDDDAVLVVA